MIIAINPYFVLLSQVILLPIKMMFMIYLTHYYQTVDHVFHLKCLKLFVVPKDVSIKQSII